MIEKNCSSCGSNLKYDAITKKLVCPYCGKVEEVFEKDNPKKATFEDVDAALARGDFAKASRFVVELKKKYPDDPRVTKRWIYCSFRCLSFSEILSRDQKNAVYMKNVRSHPGFSQLRQQLPEDQKDLAYAVTEYCDNCIEILEGNEARARQRIAEQAKKNREVVKLPAVHTREGSGSIAWIGPLLVIAVVIYLLVKVHDSRDTMEGLEIGMILFYGGVATVAAYAGVSLIEDAIRGMSKASEREWSDASKVEKPKVSEDDIVDLQKRNEELLSRVEQLEGMIR